jgi:hypothetical protein
MAIQLFEAASTISKVKRHVIGLNRAQAEDPIVIEQWYNFAYE